jgi:hypothetical protein
VFASSFWQIVLPAVFRNNYFYFQKSQTFGAEQKNSAGNGISFALAM